MALLGDMATMKLLTDPTSAIRPRMIIVHTMDGFLGGTDSHFRNPDVETEAHFGIGGPADPAGFDGVIWQWVDTEQKAEANGRANGFAISIETSDGGDPNTPWSSRQVDALVRLIDRLCRLHSIPKRLVTGFDDAAGGLGWHSMFREWNKNNHACPSDVRVNQLKTEVIPALDGNPNPPRDPEEIMPFTISRHQGGYIVVDGKGDVFPGPPDAPAPKKGSLPELPIVPSAPIVAGAWTPSGEGYWLIGSDGALFAFGDAPGILGSNDEPLRRHVGERRICGLVATGPRSVKIIAEEKAGDFDFFDATAP
jgi:hypothetical protein